MAKWINFPVTNGFDGASPPVSDPTMDGDNLVLASSIVSVTAATTGGGGTLEMEATLKLDGPTGAQTLVIPVGTNASLTYRANAPASTGYVNKLKEAINKAITANPGGVKSTVSLPQDVADASAKYDPTKKVYIKGFILS